jgi:D-3-phosphoglycerate dehydrogenase / 2-oxoglutarate reductase
LREANRGHEISGKTIGLIGYGHMGKAFASVLRGLNVKVVFHDIISGIDNDDARQVSLAELQKCADVVSLHVPETELTIGMVNAKFISQFVKPFWLINTARGKAVVTDDLVEALKTGKIRGAALDVLEYEKSSFEDMFKNNTLPEAFSFLSESDNVILSPHIAGWTVESHQKLALVLLDKIKAAFA